VQTIELPCGKIQAGAGWNPVYGSYITANTRIKVCEIQKALQSDCLAVHTDSVMTLRPIDEYAITDGRLGNYAPVAAGRAIIVACGMYQIGDECAFKGFRPSKRFPTWEAILTYNANRKKVRYRVNAVESWLDAMAKNHPKSAINVFHKAPKDILLNGDVKRLWYREVRGRDLLDPGAPGEVKNSLPKVHVEMHPPKHW